MKRYEINAYTEYALSEQPFAALEIKEKEDGEWVEHKDAQAKIDKLTECLRQVRASILGWQPDEPTPMRHQMALALQRINDVMYSNKV